MAPTLLSLGHGYSARALTRLLIPQGWTVHGTTRNHDKAPGLRAAGVIPHVLPADLAGPLSEATHLLISAGPDAEGDPMLRHMRDEITAAAPRLTWAGYLSTTGVYGDHGGDWVLSLIHISEPTRPY